MSQEINTITEDNRPNLIMSRVMRIQLGIDWPSTRKYLRQSHGNVAVQTVTEFQASELVYLQSLEKAHT